LSYRRTYARYYNGILGASIQHERTVFHTDANSAYLSWEATWRLQHGAAIDLRAVPSIVGGDPESRHGFVLAKSTPPNGGIRVSDPTLRNGAVAAFPGTNNAVEEWTIRAVATNKSGITTERSITFTIDRKAPVLVIDAVKDTKESKFTLTGHVDEASTIYVNGRKECVLEGSNGGQIVIKDILLKKGTNNFLVKAVDHAGNETIIKLKVKRK